MKRLTCFILAFLSSFPLFGQSDSIYKYVNVYIGTGGDHGQMDPAACIPFGMVKLGPDTKPRNHAGYNYNSQNIIGFSHTRISGVGCEGAGGDISILPGIESFETVATFQKKNEFAEPGFYRIELDNAIKVELTATNQTGFHRYTFPKTDSAFFIVDLGRSFGGRVSYSYNIEADNQISGIVEGHNVCGIGRYHLNFILISNKKLFISEIGNGLLKASFSVLDEESIELQVTLSPISIEQAVWDAKVSSEFSFEYVQRKAKERWEEMLCRIRVEGKEEYKILFYTHLYHSLLNPVNTTSSDGTYMGTNGTVYSARDYTHYDCWSIWDNFRNKFSLYSLVYPEIASDIARSLHDLYRTGKSKWSGNNEPFPTVRTEHSLLVLLDMYRRGIKGIDLESIYSELNQEIANMEYDSPDTKLEYSYDCWGMAQIAGILEKKQDSVMFMNKAMDYKQGSLGWKENFKTLGKDADIMHAHGLYEGTLWQYRWHVQFDINGLIDLIGNKAKYIEELNYFFENNLYNHGNQPDIHVPYMFNPGGAPWLTQKWVDRILTKETINRYGTHGYLSKPFIGRVYSAKPEGYLPEMDDDDGTMSAWYVLSSIGLYPLTVGKPEFQLSTPIFDRVILNSGMDNEFEIICINQSEENFYIQSIILNDGTYQKSYLLHSMLLQGGKMIVNLSDSPNQSYWK